MNYLKTLLLSSVAIAILVSLASCTGYPEGPKVSFTAAVDKISTTWRVKSAIENGTDVTARYNEEFFKFEEDGDFETIESTYSVSIPPFTQDTVLTVQGFGTWQFVADESGVEMLYAFSFQDPYNSEVFYREEINERYDILRLSQEELWLRNDSVFLKMEFFTE